MTQPPNPSRPAMTEAEREAMVALAERLRNRASQERQIAENSLTVAALLEPQLALFEAREAPWNTYAVRMAIDHRNSAKKDAAFADDLDAAADAIVARANQGTPA